MLNLTEAEIMANWPVNGPIRVSVCCITYKQEQYVAQAIDSFLMQKTTFPFEIVIGEDCGGDDTLLILNNYQKRYPNLIKIITSEQNVGANANLLRVLNAARGDYIAICEGDDYWVYDLKIQEQFDCLQNSHKVNICFAKAMTLDKNGLFNSVTNYKENVFTVSDVTRGGGGFMVTATIFFRRKVVEFIPEWFSKAPIGDFYLQVIASLGGGALYINQTVAVYRLNAESSWTRLSQLRDTQKVIADLNACVEYTQSLVDLGVSESDIKYAVARHESQAAKLFLLKGEYSEFYSSIVRSVSEYKWINMQQRIQFIFRGVPFLLKIVFQTRDEITKILNSFKN